MTKYAPRVCDICGEPYEPTSPTQKVCAQVECAREHDRRKQARHRAEKRSRRPPAEPVVFAIKKCESCGEDFRPNSAPQKYCKKTECHAARQRKYRTNYIEKPGIRDRDNARARERGQEPEVKEKKSHYHRKRKYGIDEKMFNDLLAKQGGGCLVCGVTPDKPDVRYCIDHDHLCCPGDISCGRCVRGILCQNCNSAEGFLSRAAKQTGRTIEDVLLRFFVFSGQWSNRPVDAEPRVPVPPFKIVVTDNTQRGEPVSYEADIRLSRVQFLQGNLITQGRSLIAEHSAAERDHDLPHGGSSIGADT